MPSHGVAVLNSYMVGITSFQLNTTQPISLSSLITTSQFLQIGPINRNCQINYIQASYLIISVFTDCGASLPYNINFNGTCVSSCPQGYFAVNGKCQFMSCAPGSYLLNGTCNSCPKHSDIKQCNNSCIIGYKLSGEDCIPICSLDHEIYVYGICVCAFGFYRINGGCSQCATGTKYDNISLSCVSICSNNSYFDMTTLRCKCLSGLYLVNGSCIKCQSWQIYDQSWENCHAPCGIQEYYNGIQCDCKYNYAKVNGVCVQCKDNQTYNMDIKQCILKCSTNQIQQGSFCVCIPGYYKMSGVCQKCPSGQIWRNGLCYCPQNTYYIMGVCQACPTSTAYDQQSQTCQPICKLQYQQYLNGTCSCIPGTIIDNTTGNCNPKQCPDNSIYNLQSDTCICSDTFYLNSSIGQCIKTPQCPENSIFIFGFCICNSDYFMNSDSSTCIKCNDTQHQVFNGQECVCFDGYIRDFQGNCNQIPTTISCNTNEIYNNDTKSCDCSQGYQRIAGNCVLILNCTDNQYWNGVACICNTGYTLNTTTKSCQTVTIPIPKCPFNSNFNGIKCICNPKFFQLQPGLCAICPPNMTWNGKKCAYSKDCFPGYIWDNFTQCCAPLATQCPPHSAWNGQSCQCNPGYFLQNNHCTKCQSGYQFDGLHCTRVQKTISCAGTNMIVVNKQCVCIPGTNNYNGNCILCQPPTIWNGLYCQGNNDGCLTVPNSHINPTNSKCQCDPQYRSIGGSCIAIMQNCPCANLNNPYGSTNINFANYRSTSNYNFMNGIAGAASLIGGSNVGVVATGNTIKTGTNYSYTNGQILNLVNTQTYQYPSSQSTYGYYMANNNGQAVPFTTNIPFQYNQNMQYGPLYSQSNPTQASLLLPPQLNGINLNGTNQNFSSVQNAPPTNLSTNASNKLPPNSLNIQSLPPKYYS